MIARRVSHILVPIDFRPGSDAALRYAKMLAASFGAKLYLLHVLDDVTANVPSAAGSHKAAAGAVKASTLDAGTRLCNLLSGEEVKRFHAAGALVFGSRAASITTYARDHGIDLIVMGASGCTRLAERAVGNVTERVVRTAPCPVLTVRDSGAIKLLHLERAHHVAVNHPLNAPRATVAT